MVSNALMGQEEQCDFYYMTFGIVGSSRARVHSDTVFTASEENSYFESARRVLCDLLIRVAKRVCRYAIEISSISALHPIQTNESALSCGCPILL